ncbi:hypothetical protein ACQ4M3_37965 [Leptolyngbya sp. AN03gr2]|uniref:hypothetical protein n=1 Tax=unclassified Leptolyngbya TaxID=2650499 RepID=UPI003D323FE3
MSRSPFSLFSQQYFATLLSRFGTVYLNEPVPRDPKLRIYKHPSRSDFGTAVLGALAEGSPQVWINPEIIAEAELVDVLFEPDPTTSKAVLGILGDLLIQPCIIESLRSLPTTREFRTCLGHWLRWQVETDGSIIPVDEEAPTYSKDECEENDEDEELESNQRLLVIVPQMTAKQLEGWGARLSHRHIAGLYELPPAYCTTIVCTRELPETIETLWLRLLSRGATQRRAIQDLIKLETNHSLRSVALHPLQSWYWRLCENTLNRESKLLMQGLSQIAL